MSERPFLPKPGPPSGSGPDWVLDRLLRQARALRPSGGTAVRPLEGWRRQRARPGSTDSAAGEPGAQPEAPTLQPEEPPLSRRGSHGAGGDAEPRRRSLGPARTSPDGQLGGHQAADAG